MKWIVAVLLGAAFAAYGSFENDPNAIFIGATLIALPSLYAPAESPAQRKRRRDERIAALERELGL